VKPSEKVGLRFIKYLTVTFSVGSPMEKLSIVFCSRQPQFRMIGGFCVEGSDKSSDCGHSSNDFQIFVIHTLRAS